MIRATIVVHSSDVAFARRVADRINIALRSLERDGTPMSVTVELASHHPRGQLLGNPQGR